MKPWNCPTCSADCLVLDTTVVMNLFATDRPEATLQSLPNRTQVAENAAVEVARVRSRFPDTAYTLAEGKRLEIVSLDSAAERCFDVLGDGTSGHTLGDGEAATIARALDGSATAPIDDRKSARFCGGRPSISRRQGRWICILTIKFGRHSVTIEWRVPSIARCTTVAWVLRKAIAGGSLQCARSIRAARIRFSNEFVPQGP